MTDTYDMSNITQAELQELISENTSRIAESKETMVGEHSMQAHSSCMKKSFVAKIAQRSMAVDNLNLLSDEDLPQMWEGRENCRERG